MNRRALLGLLAGGAAGWMWTDLSTEPPLRGLTPRPDLPWSPLLRTADELDLVAPIEGRLPEVLRGRLYRNGPGRFERGGAWKRTLLEGDGLVQAFHVANGEVRYRSRFVRTTKLEAEERAGRFLSATLGTQAPGGAWRNVGGLNVGYPASVTVLPDGADLLAFDEPGRPYRLDPETLATRGPTDLGQPGAVYNAHAKRVGDDLMLFGMEYGPINRVHLTAVRGGVALWHRTFDTVEAHFVHDWFVTPRWCVVLLQPVIAWAYPFLAGRTSLLSCLQWWPHLGTPILLVPRDGVGPPTWIHHDPVFFLHALGAAERGGELVLDLLRYPSPDAFFGPAIQLAELAQRDPGRTAVSQGSRWILDPARGTARDEALPLRDCEMPVRAGDGHLTLTGSTGPVFYHAVARVRPDEGVADRFDFGSDVILSEPASTGQGYALVEAYDARRGVTGLHVLDEARLSDGPVASAWLDRPVYPGIHGCWVPHA